MKMGVRKEMDAIKMVSGMVVDLPASSGLSYMWGFGSLLGVFLFMQVLSGIFLAMQFSGGVEVSFNSVVHLMRDVEWGWLLRVLHSNGASVFFLLLYLHMGRGLYYGSYSLKGVWVIGVSIFLVSMVTAFMGYVLPWGQMSFWAATVITNLMSVIPVVGRFVVEWVWGGFAVGNATLTRFFAFHYVMPIGLLVLVMVHLMSLHSTGSSNPLGVGRSEDSVVFYPYFVVSDLVGLVLVVTGMIVLCAEMPFLLMDTENFIPANSLVTPVHIQPEWYFLFAYAILRSISSKVGGVVALVMSVLVMFVFPYMFDFKGRVVSYYMISRGVFWWIVVNWMLLTWIGSCVVEYPYSELGKIFSVLYFLLFGLFYMGFVVQERWGV